MSESRAASPRLEELEAAERVARERYQLYRARVYGPRATSLDRLRQLEHAWKLAQSRMLRARAGERPGAANSNGAAR
jgi:hypothetical protein